MPSRKHGVNHNLPPSSKDKAAWQIWESLHPFHRVALIATQCISQGKAPTTRLRCPKCGSDRLTFGAAGMVTPIGDRSAAELTDREGGRHIIAGLPLLGIEDDCDTIAIYQCSRGHIIVDSTSFVDGMNTVRSQFAIECGISGVALLFAKGSGVSK